MDWTLLLLHTYVVERHYRCCFSSSPLHLTSAGRRKLRGDEKAAGSGTSEREPENTKFSADLLGQLVFESFQFIQTGLGWAGLRDYL